MNLVTEYVSRPEIAPGLFKLPSSIMAVTDFTANGKNVLRTRVLTFSPILRNLNEVMLRLYGVGTDDAPFLIKEQNIFLKYLFTAEAFKPIFEGCRMMPYLFDTYPADIVYNDPPLSVEQEKSVAEYFKNFHNSMRHQEYRRTLLWYDFITHHGSKLLLSNYGGSLSTNDLTYVNPENVKKHDKVVWKKWISWCDHLCLQANNNWANELLFAKCLPRMTKKDLMFMAMSFPVCEDVG